MSLGVSVQRSPSLRSGMARAVPRTSCLGCDSVAAAWKSPAHCGPAEMPAGSHASLVGRTAARSLCNWRNSLGFSGCRIFRRGPGDWERLCAGLGSKSYEFSFPADPPNYCGEASGSRGFVLRAEMKDGLDRITRRRRIDPLGKVQLQGGSKRDLDGHGGCNFCQSGWSKLNSQREISATGSIDECLLEEEVGKAEGKASIVEDLLAYLNASWTPFHATMESKRILLEAGFQQIREEDEWDVHPGGRYFFTRNMSSIFAFAVGSKYQLGRGFNVVAAHTDSPCPKLKPVSAASKAGFLNVGVQTYGGGLWHTWFDRDLSVAGRVLVHRGDRGILHELVRIDRPIMRIPTLAIHLDRSVNTDGFKPNLESHLAPILATQIRSELSHGEGNGAIYSLSKSHHPLLLQILAEELKCAPGDIADFELNVCDTQPSCIGGARNEFIFSGRLDNLASSYCALRGLVDTCKDPMDLAEESSIRVVALFDNEEVGSDSAQGASSPTMFQAMGRIIRCLTRDTASEGIVERTLRRSFLVSADMAHALHPNYSDRHEEHHQPRLHEGLVIKHNANQRYATNSVTSFLFKEVARLAGVPTQSFVVRNDMGCGSTIGPILASGIGIRTVDVGMPQLSMHSVREMCGTQDVDISYRHFMAFYQSFTSVDEKLSIDS